MKKLDFIVSSLLLLYGVGHLILSAYRDPSRSGYYIFIGVIVITLAIIIQVIGMRKLLPLQIPNTASDIKNNFILAGEIVIYSAKLN